MVVCMLLALAMPAQNPPTSTEPDLVFRFDAWPPVTETDKRRAMTLRKLMNLPSTRVALNPREQSVEFHIWLNNQPERVFQIIETNVSPQELQQLRRGFPTLTMEATKEQLFILGNTDEVEKLKSYLPQLASIAVGPTNASTPFRRITTRCTGAGNVRLLRFARYNRWSAR